MALRRAPASEGVLKNSSMLLESHDGKLINPLGDPFFPLLVGLQRAHGHQENLVKGKTTSEAVCAVAKHSGS